MMKDMLLEWQESEDQESIKTVWCINCRAITDHNLNFKYNKKLLVNGNCTVCHNPYKVEL